MMAEMTRPTTKSYLEQAHTAIAALSDCLPWHQEDRRQSLAKLSRLGLPLSRNEFWKYSRLRNFLPPLSELEGEAGSLPGSQSAGLQAPDLKAPAIDTQGGCHIGVRGREIEAVNLPDGLVIETFSENNRGIVEQHLNRGIDTSRYPLALLNDALLQNGILIRALKGAHIDVPVILSIAPSPGSPLWEASRLMILLEPDSQLTLIEQQTEYPIGSTVCGSALWQNPPV